MYQHHCTECGKPFQREIKRGGCCSHACKWVSYRRRMTATFPSRFWEKIDKSGECWIWRGPVQDARGYGMVRDSGHPKKDFAHRVAYRLTHGDILKGMHIMHTCDTPSCCNPEHLKQVTQAENNADMRRKRRHRFGINHQHAKLTDDAVRNIRSCSLSPSELAIKYGVSTATIQDARCHRTWVHIK